MAISLPGVGALLLFEMNQRIGVALASLAYYSGPVRSTNRKRITESASAEVDPVWFDVDQLPYEQMWQDARHWLPRIMTGECIRMRFVFDQDNETVREVNEEQRWLGRAGVVDMPPESCYDRTSSGGVSAQH